MDGERLIDRSGTGSDDLDVVPTLDQPASQPKHVLRHSSGAIEAIGQDKGDVETHSKGLRNMSQFPGS